MNNTFLQDKNLSLQAKGLLAEILSNKDDWKIYLKELEKRSKNGRESHSKAFKELKDAGYIRTILISKGRGSGIERHLFAQDKPIPDWYLDYLKENIIHNT